MSGTHRWILLAAAVCAGCAASPSKFRSFEVRRHDGVGPSFNYSSAAATSEDPVVITVVGRAMTVQDRQLRTDLQKNWLQANVPARFQWADRAQFFCGPVGRDKQARCDGYTYSDPKTNERRDYYFYLNNWP